VGAACRGYRPVRMIWDIHPALSGSLRFDARDLDHLGPFRGFVGDELSEIGGRAHERRAAKLGEPRLDLGIGEASVDFMVQPADDLGRRVLGRTDCNKCAGLEARQEFAQSRHIRELIRARLSAHRECAQLARPDMLDGRGQVVEGRLDLRG
jgi:hypothetical protein